MATNNKIYWVEGIKFINREHAKAYAAGLALKAKTDIEVLQKNNESEDYDLGFTVYHAIETHRRRYIPGGK